jgi:hypothetical protein
VKKQIVSKLHLNKETLRHLSERDLQGAVGGYVTQWCPPNPTGMSECFQCPTESCLTGDSCLTPTRAANCC